MRVTFYVVQQDDAMGHEIAVPTLSEAKKISKEIMEEETAILGDGRIVRIDTGEFPIRELVSRIYNRECFAVKQTELHKGFTESDRGVR